MIFLNIFWILFAQYFWSIYESLASDETTHAQQVWFENFSATFADLLFIIHDWLFIEQILVASLMMPIALNTFSEDAEEAKLKL